LVVAVVVLVLLVAPPVDTLGDEPEEHAAPSKAKARTPAANHDRRRGIRRSGEVCVLFIMTLSTGR
jgi:hypothetical protein